MGFPGRLAFKVSNLANSEEKGKWFLKKLKEKLPPLRHSFFLPVPVANNYPAYRTQLTTQVFTCEQLGPILYAVGTSQHGANDVYGVFCRFGRAPARGRRHYGHKTSSQTGRRGGTEKALADEPVI